MGDIEVEGFRIVDRVVGGARDAYIAHREGQPWPRYVLTALELTQETEAALRRDVESLACDCDAFLRVHDVVRCDHRVLLICEQHDGVDLPRLVEHLAATGATFGALCEIGLQVARAVVALHASDQNTPRVHGAITPQQVLVTRNGDVRIQGLGLGVLHDRALARGTLPEEVSCFLAPERLRGAPITTRTDVYGTALLLWWLLSRGSLPGDDGLDIEELSSNAPSTLWSALAEALDGEPDARPESCAELVEVLAPLVGPEDATEMRWSLEALHATAVVDEQLPVPDSIRPEDDDSIPAYTSSIPPDEEDRPTIIQGVPVVEIASHRSSVVSYGEAGPSLPMIQSALSALVSASTPRVRRRRRRRGDAQTKLGGFAPESVRAIDEPSERAEPNERAEPRKRAEPRERAEPSERSEPRAPSRPAPKEPTPPEPRPRDEPQPPARQAPSRPPRRDVHAALLGAAAVGVLWLASSQLPGRDAPAAGATPTTASSAQAQPTEPARPEPPTEPAPPAPASARPEAPATPAEDASPGDGGSPEPTDDTPDPKALDRDHGYLVVQSKARDARVYVKGAPIGAPGELLEVRCGPTWVRLGTEPFRVWLSEGRPIAVPCRGTATLVLDE